MFWNQIKLHYWLEEFNQLHVDEFVANAHSVRDRLCLSDEIVHEPEQVAHIHLFAGKIQIHVVVGAHLVSRCKRVLAQQMQRLGNALESAALIAGPL